MIVAFAIAVFLGVRAVQQVPVDAFPDATPVRVNVYTESLGLAAENVETLLTVPIETAMVGLPDVEQVRSVPLFGLSYVGAYFPTSLTSTLRGGWLTRGWPGRRPVFPRAMANPNWPPAASVYKTLAHDLERDLVPITGPA